MLELPAEQLAELRDVMRTSPVPHLRIKATALWNWGRGKTRAEVADFLGVAPASVTAWAQRYQAAGLAGLTIRPGRGRKAQADPAEVAHYLRQTPRTFGLAHTRWTLRGLAQVVPSLHGFSDVGVLKVLRRLGYGYKRGQPVHHSPDPQYAEKKGPWSKRCGPPPRDRRR